MSMLAPVPSADPRVAPHNLDAEQSTLGGMLLSQEAVAEVFETVSGVDFYAPKHELIFNAVLSLFGKGEPTDVIAVTDELNKQGNLVKAGGADYLHSLTGYVPTAANAGYYAKIVADKAILRRLIEAGTRIAQAGYESQGEVEDLVNQAQAEIYKVSSQSSKEDYVPLSDSLEAAIHEIEGAQKRGVSESIAERIWNLIDYFSGYGFNKSHSAAYAIVSYQTAWLKAHYPAHFMAATMSSDMDKTDKVVTFIEECRTMKLKLLPPAA